MTKQLNYTKFLVTIGFIIIASFAITGIALIYGELVKFSEISDTSEERKELVVIGSTLVSLYKLEGTTSQIAGKSIDQIKLNYDSLMVNIHAHIDTLKKISPDLVLNVHLDSVNSLLDLKKRNTWSMLLLLDSVEKRSIIETSQTTVLSKKNLDELSKILKNTTTSSEDTAIIRTEKKHFFQRVKDVFNTKAADSSLVVSKNQKELRDSIIVPLLTDTITQYINNLVLTHDQKNDAIMRKLISRQHSLSLTNEEITTQINQIMRDIETREYQTSLNLLKEKEVTLKRSSRIVGIIGLLALVSTLLFVFLVMRSLTRSQQYRKQLEYAIKRAEHLSIARERLILTITHDIKAPLASIIGFIELLFKSKLPEKEKYYLENMQNSSEHVLELVKNLLDFHTMESDKEAIKSMPFFPHILLDDIFQSFVPLAKKGSLSFQFNYAGSPNEKEINYISDPYRIRQIVSNLLSNAIKFCNVNGEVDFLAKIENTNNQQILIISIKDSGPGISDEDKKVIFEEFKRLDNSKSQSIEGSGLGLAITKKLVQLLKGSISIVSSPGKGAEFIVKIPLDKSNEKMNFALQNQETNKQIVFNVNPNKKILFIDDDLVQLNLLSELLKQKGFAPTICKNSLDALVLLQKTRFDIVFSDIQMPEMNGFELVERIRMATFPGCESLPVIALSGSSDISENEFIQAGFSGFLPKPFTSDQILNVIQRFLGVDKDFNQKNKPTAVKGFSALSNFAGDDIKAGAEIIQSFIDENKRNVDTFKKAFKKEDLEKIKNTSHKMLPLMRMIAADEIVAILSEFENGIYFNKNENELIHLIENQIKEAESFLSELNKNTKI